MAKTVARRPKRVASGTRRPRSRRTGWVRKNVIMDQRKLDAVRRVLGVETETEASDQDLDLSTFGMEVAKGIAAVRRSVGVESGRETLLRV